MRFMIVIVEDEQGQIAHKVEGSPTCGQLIAALEIVKHQVLQETVPAEKPTVAIPNGSMRRAMGIN